MSSAAALADAGVTAVKNGQYAEGIAKLTAALQERPAPLWLLERSKAHLRTGDLDRALHDAERALRVAFDRANRDQMIEAQLRRAATYHRRRQYADADVCAFWAARLCDGAKASEDDGRLRALDSQGDYTATLSEVTPKPGRSAKDDGLAAAMGGGSGGSGGKAKQLANQALMWRTQALTKLETLPAGDPGRKITITEKYPTPPEEFPTNKPISDESDDADTATGEATGGATATAPRGGGDEASRKAAWQELWEKFRSIHAKNDIRSSFYQTDATLNVDFFVKNVPKDEFKVDSKTDSVVLSPIPNTHTKKIHLFLYGKIKPEETKFTVKSMKVELVLKKDTPGKWPALRKADSELVDNLALASFPAPSFNQFYKFVTSLGYQSPKDLDLKHSTSEEAAWYDALSEKLRDGYQTLAGTTADQATSSKTAATIASESAATPVNTAATAQSTAPADATNKPKPAATASASASGPAYPTSSKKGPKNWDNIDDEEADEKDGDSGDVNSFFQSIYKNADPDTRRAMMKSFVESNGTSLSTNWDEAKSKTYESVPPDGAEAKKW